MHKLCPHQERAMRAFRDRDYSKPWPVNPAKYPLTGPSSGPVYCPEPADDWVPVVTKGFITGVAIAFGIALIGVAGTLIVVWLMTRNPTID